ncbi:MAG: chromosome segregation protein SMC [Ignavibacteria bacterium]|nr:chromosome segregation protein SMC [Ignavibacteria bacterium]
MYLSKLEIFGFKSFANKVEIKFTDGLTAIVGPNGCGKTNVVDALRWVLGEQRTSTLRSDKMENVIFNGTRNRKPIGLAEVSLTVQNNKNILPIDYSDVTITRRLYRSGESEYLLNKSICRLKDITNLFMDTGMSANAYSVIELKMVESILSNKADDRRVLFEEAAGVNKYKHRRKAALRKLDACQQDLIRVNDIHAEVQKKVNSLERQSKKAEQFTRIYGETKELEIGLAEREYSKYLHIANSYRVQLENLHKEKDSIGEEIRKLEEEQQHLYHELDAIELKLSSKREEILFQTEAIHKIQEQIITFREKSLNAEVNINRFQKETSENAVRISELHTFISNSELEIENFLTNISAITQQLAVFGEKKDELTSYLTLKRETAGLKQDELKKLNDHYNESKNNFEKINLRTQNNQESIENLNARLTESEETVDKAARYLSSMMNELFAIQKRVREAEDILTFNQSRKEHLEKNIDKLKQEELEVKGLLNGVKTKIDFIKNLIENLEGISKGTKELLSKTQWNRGTKILAADAGSVEDKYKIAIDTLLKNFLSHILLERRDDLFEGIKFLKERHLGQASFYLFEIKKEGFKGFINQYFLKRTKRKIEREAGFTCWVIDLIECSAHWRRFFETTIGNICLVESIQAAKNITSKYSDIDCVTIDGDVFRSNGLVEIGSEKTSVDTAFGRQKVLSELNDIFTKESYKLDKITNQLEDTINEANSIDIKAYTESLNLLRIDEANLEKQVSQIQFEKNKAVEEIEKLNTEIVNLKKINDDLELKKISFTEELNLLTTQIDSAEKNFKSDSTDLTNLENQFSSLITEENETKIQLTKVQSEQTNKLNLIELSKNEIASLQSTNDRRNNEIAQAENEINDLKLSNEEHQAKKNILEEEKNSLNNELNVITKDYNTIRDSIGEHDKRLNKKRKTSESLSNEIHSKELTVNECELKSQNLAERINEEYQIKLVYKDFEDLETYNFDEVSQTVHLLKNKMRMMGPINSLAFAEFEEEKKRLLFLTEQRTDLVDAEKQLHQVIEEINATAQKLFLETFQQIRINFIDIFRTLFDQGDEADLKLEENIDPLEAKIEIIAKPKGKRPTSIDLLSGGEKTLTATALLFAIYLVKPSPFCILDEVDAPLDDANIGRFVRLIKRFSENTQFIIVTHNKLTMESAQTLYGVTMEEEGISKLVSVRFNEELRVA